MASVSNPFRHLSRDILDMIASAHSVGKTTEQISMQFGLDHDDVVTYVENFVATPRSQYDRLQEIVDDLEDQCTQTRLELDGNRSAMMIQSYQKLMSEYRLSLAELAGLQSPKDLSDSIMDKVIKPFLVSLIKISTEETAKLKADLLRLNVPARDSHGIAVDLFSRIGSRMEDLLPSVMEGIDRSLGVKRPKKKESELERAKLSRSTNTSDSADSAEDEGKTTLQ